MSSLMAVGLVACGCFALSCSHVSLLLGAIPDELVSCTFCRTGRPRLPKLLHPVGPGRLGHSLIFGWSFYPRTLWHWPIGWTNLPAPTGHRSFQWKEGSSFDLPACWTVARILEALTALSTLFRRFQILPVTSSRRGFCQISASRLWGCV